MGKQNEVDTRKRQKDEKQRAASLLLVPVQTLTMKHNQMVDQSTGRTSSDRDDKKEARPVVKRRVKWSFALLFGSIFLALLVLLPLTRGGSRNHSIPRNDGLKNPNLQGSISVESSIPSIKAGNTSSPMLFKDGRFSSHYNRTILQLRANPPSYLSLVSVPKKQGLAKIQHVDWMLDFAIIGFAKCGTSYLKYWINQSQVSYLDPKETIGLATRKPANVVAQLYRAITVLNQPPKTNRLGIKFPGDIDSESSLQYYRTLFPSTKFIVQLRHPVLWFQSFWNFRFRSIVRMKKRMHARQNKTYSHEPSKVLLSPNKMIGSCWLTDKTAEYRCFTEPGCDRHKYSVCTHRAQFHHAISRLGLTPLSTEEEWTILDYHNMTIDRTAGDVFFMELTQLYASAERKGQLRNDLSQFLDIDDLPSMPDYQVPYERIEGEIDICEAEHDEVRRVLLLQAQKASTWIQTYLLKSPRAIVSSRSYFIELIETWKNDPCDERGR